MNGVTSVDVFDTVLIRLLGSPRQVFVATAELLARRGVVTVSAEVFRAARERAHADLTVDVALHPPLEQIMADVARRLGLPADSVGPLVEAELDVERATLRAVPGRVAELAAARRRTGRGVVFVSDTPLPAPFLESVLRAESLFCPGDRLYTSARWQASKQDGGLFDVVAADLGVPGALVDHTGDDELADVAHARRHGWHAELSAAGRLTARETRLDRTGPQTAGLGPRLAGAARYGRLRSVEDGIAPALAGIAGSVALPVLVGFGLWVLQQAELERLDRLYFVSRDGEVLREVTDALARHDGDGVECCYLYGSRQLWQPAADGPADLLLDYLDQQGVTGPGRVGVVDVGWSGRSVRALDDVLIAAGRARPVSYLFLGLQHGAPSIMGPDLYARAQGWLLDEARGRVAPRGPEVDPVMLVESLTMGREGHLTGLRRVGARVEPTLRAAVNPAADRWEFAAYRRALDHALAAFLDGPAPTRRVDLRPAAWEQLLGLWEAPDREEARLWGAQPYGEDFHNARTHPLATPLTVRRLLTFAGVGRASWRTPTYWRAGSIALSRPALRTPLLLAHRHRALPRRLRRVPDRLRLELARRRA